jgi:hypothetical protein
LILHWYLFYFWVPPILPSLTGECDADNEYEGLGAEAEEDEVGEEADEEEDFMEEEDWDVEDEHEEECHHFNDHEYDHDMDLENLSPQDIDFEVEDSYDWTYSDEVLLSYENYYLPFIKFMRFLVKNPKLLKKK